MEEKIINTINGMCKDDIYDTCLERIICFARNDKDLTRENIVNFVNDEIDYTECECTDDELKGWVCEVFRTFLNRF